MIWVQPGNTHDAHQQAASAGGEVAVLSRPALLDIQSRKLALKLVRHDGAEIDFINAIDTPGPIFLNFIYTSCTTVCPLMGQIFAELQPMLRARGRGARMISVSIDPEYDTPTRLSEHATAFGAGADWHFYTGTLKASEDLQQAFGVYTPDKMNHPIATFYRAAKGARWFRIDGFATPDELLQTAESIGRSRPRPAGKTR